MCDSVVGFIDVVSSEGCDPVGFFKTVSFRYMKITRNKITVAFPGLRMNEFDIPKFRGYLANRYSEYTLIHNHLPGGKFYYHYPLIQFKVVDKVPMMIGIADGVDILKKVFVDIAHLDIDGKSYTIDEKSVQLQADEIGQVNQPQPYRFLLPWMALNQENYRKYRSIEWKQRRDLLESIIFGNLMSLSRGLNYEIPSKEDLTVISGLKSVTRNFKNNRMLCFEGTFQTNFIIPDYLGIGKQTARGFGTLKRADL